MINSRAKELFMRGYEVYDPAGRGCTILESPHTEISDSKVGPTSGTGLLHRRSIQPPSMMARPGMGLLSRRSEPVSLLGSRHAHLDPRLGYSHAHFNEQFGPNHAYFDQEPDTSQARYSDQQLDARFEQQLDAHFDQLVDSYNGVPLPEEYYDMPSDLYDMDGDTFDMYARQMYGMHPTSGLHETSGIHPGMRPNTAGVHGSSSHNVIDWGHERPASSEKLLGSCSQASMGGGIARTDPFLHPKEALADAPHETPRAPAEHFSMELHSKPRRKKTKKTKRAKAATKTSDSDECARTFMENPLGASSKKSESETRSLNWMQKPPVIAFSSRKTYSVLKPIGGTEKKTGSDFTRPKPQPELTSSENSLGHASWLKTSCPDVLAPIGSSNSANKTESAAANLRPLPEVQQAISQVGDLEELPLPCVNPSPVSKSEQRQPCENMDEANWLKKARDSLTPPPTPKVTHSDSEDSFVPAWLKDAIENLTPPGTPNAKRKSTSPSMSDAPRSDSANLDSDFEMAQTEFPSEIGQSPSLQDCDKNYEESLTDSLPENVITPLTHHVDGKNTDDTDGPIHEKCRDETRSLTNVMNNFIRHQESALGSDQMPKTNIRQDCNLATKTNVRNSTMVAAETRCKHEESNEQPAVDKDRIASGAVIINRVSQGDAIFNCFGLDIDTKNNSVKSKENKNQTSSICSERTAAEIACFNEDSESADGNENIGPDIDTGPIGQHTLGNVEGSVEIPSTAETTTVPVDTKRYVNKAAHIKPSLDVEFEKHFAKKEKHGDFPKKRLTEELGAKYTTLAKKKEIKRCVETTDAKDDLISDTSTSSKKFIDQIKSISESKNDPMEVEKTNKPPVDCVVISDVAENAEAKVPEVKNMLVCRKVVFAPEPIIINGRPIDYISDNAESDTELQLESREDTTLNDNSLCSIDDNIFDEDYCTSEANAEKRETLVSIPKMQQSDDLQISISVTSRPELDGHNGKQCKIMESSTQLTDSEPENLPKVVICSNEEGDKLETIATRIKHEQKSQYISMGTKSMCHDKKAMPSNKRDIHLGDVRFSTESKSNSNYSEKKVDFSNEKEKQTGFTHINSKNLAKITGYSNENDHQFGTSAIHARSKTKYIVKEDVFPNKEYKQNGTTANVTQPKFRHIAKKAMTSYEGGEHLEKAVIETKSNNYSTAKDVIPFNKGEGRILTSAIQASPKSYVNETTMHPCKEDEHIEAHELAPLAKRTMKEKQNNTINNNDTYNFMLNGEGEKSAPASLVNQIQDLFYDNEGKRKETLKELFKDEYIEILKELEHERAQKEGRSIQVSRKNKHTDIETEEEKSAKRTGNMELRNDIRAEMSRFLDEIKYVRQSQELICEEVRNAYVEHFDKYMARVDSYTEHLLENLNRERAGNEKLSNMFAQSVKIANKLNDMLFREIDKAKAVTKQKVTEPIHDSLKRHQFQTNTRKMLNREWLETRAGHYFDNSNQVEDQPLLELETESRSSDCRRQRQEIHGGRWYWNWRRNMTRARRKRIAEAQTQAQEVVKEHCIEEWSEVTSCDEFDAGKGLTQDDKIDKNVKDDILGLRSCGTAETTAQWVKTVNELKIEERRTRKNNMKYKCEPSFDMLSKRAEDNNVKQKKGETNGPRGIGKIDIRRYSTNEAMNEKLGSYEGDAARHRIQKAKTIFEADRRKEQNGRHQVAIAEVRIQIVEPESCAVRDQKRVSFESSALKKGGPEEIDNTMDESLKEKNCSCGFVDLFRSFFKKK